MNYTDLDLKDTGFERYELQTQLQSYQSGIHRVFKFENGYGASIIKSWYSYGGGEDLFELAVIKFTDDDNYNLCYDTPITDDVVGHLENDKVLELLQAIKELKRVMELEKQTFIIEYVLDAATCKFGIRPSYVVFFEKEYQGDTFDYVADMIDDISKTITEVSTTPIEQARVAASQLILRGYRHDKYADCRNVENC